MDAQPSPIYPTMAYQFPQFNSTYNQQQIFKQHQPLFPTQPIMPQYAQPQPRPRCLAPSLLFDSIDAQTDSPPRHSVPPTVVSASPVSSSASSIITYTPLLDLAPVHSTADTMIRPKFSPSSALTPIRQAGHVDDVYGYTGKIEMMDGPVEAEPEVVGKKRSRTAQACEKCRVRKARVRPRSNPFNDNQLIQKSLNSAAVATHVAAALNASSSANSPTLSVNVAQPNHTTGTTNRHHVVQVPKPT